MSIVSADRRPVRVATSPVPAPAQHPALLAPWRVLALLCACVFAVASIHPFRDVDVYWHVLVGREVVENVSLADIGSDWSYRLTSRSWTTTQWLSEVLFYGLHSVGGWEAIAGMQVVAALALAAGVAGLLLWNRPSPWAGIVYILLLVVMLGVLQERPALLSMLFLIWLAASARRGLQRTGDPGALPVLLVTASWANVHGLWVLVPAVFGLIAAGRLAERDLAGSRSAARLGAVALFAGCLTPVGPALLLSPVRFAGAAGPLKEWQPTTFDDPLTLSLAAMLLLLVVAWAHGVDRVPAAEVIYVVGLSGFALLAMRNVPPAALLLAPIVVARLDAVFPRVDRVDTRAEHRLLMCVGVVAVLAASVTMSWQAARTPTLPSDVPVELARVLADEPGRHRVLNEYNVSGALLYWGGPRTSLVIDGRADRYGAAYVVRHKALMELRGDWRKTLEDYDANYAVLRRGTPLLVELEHRGWQRLDADAHHVLLRASSAPYTSDED